MKKLILLFLVVLIIFSLRNIVNSDVYKPSSLDIGTTFVRQQYLGEGLGKIYKNRFGLAYFNDIYPVLIKFESNFFSDLGNAWFFLPLFGFLIYLGFDKFNEK